ncbi:DNA repair protein rhp54 [Plakobranchus ocellatus]|uniref:DNA repair protein rhp54 n=1 Tax=Plakobranchus ocellatus TaxID=259542 RepID=A0AAV4A1H3_9GAST|nr:DNA repair protein rhp54 [Plakobranchus ocellatus]
MAHPKRKLFSSVLASAMLADVTDKEGTESEDSHYSYSDDDPDYIPGTPNDDNRRDESDEEQMVFTAMLPSSSTNDATANAKSNGFDRPATHDAPYSPGCTSHPDFGSVENTNHDNGYDRPTTHDAPDVSGPDLSGVENTNHDNGYDRPTTHDAPDALGSVSGPDLSGVENTNHDKLTRKRTRDPSNWKRNVAKRKRQAGQEYTSSKSGKIVPAKTVRQIKDCTKCKFNCSGKITQEERQYINKMFWGLDDEGKSHFYSEYTERHEKERCRGVTNTKPKTYSYTFYLRSGSSNVKERVCKTFSLSTLDITKMRISYFYTNKRCVDTGLPLPRGKYPKKKTSDDQIAQVRAHIDSFPRIPSHYCRQDTSKEYLEKALNLTKMYGMYQDWCAQNDAIPVKQHKYSEVFNTEFNIGFAAPKKDRCDKCELGRVNTNLQPTEDEALSVHILNKKKAYHERERDRIDKTKVVVCFDLENVFSLPISGVSNFFYKRKLCTFNMTAHLSLSKKSYFAIWHEGSGGRGANNMASAIVKILRQIMVDHPDTRELILWSDSCVCQNRNSVMTLALSLFLQDYPNLEAITQKFCEAGHSNIQEVD